MTNAVITLNLSIPQESFQEMLITLILIVVVFGGCAAAAKSR